MNRRYKEIMYGKGNRDGFQIYENIFNFNKRNVNQINVERLFFLLDWYRFKRLIIFCVGKGVRKQVFGV